jgi:aspartate/tyrosine/aromatic aminotransferase
VDPTEDQWRQFADVFLQKGHYAFLDCAYQGFASGDLDRDAWMVRHPAFSPSFFLPFEPKNNSVGALL